MLPYCGKRITARHGGTRMLLPTDQPMKQITGRRSPFRRRAADALGRALMSEPQLLMLDEPSLGLAPAVVEALYDTLKALHHDGLTLLLAEQSIPLALGIADYGYVLQTGRVALEGPAARLRDHGQVQGNILGVKAPARPVH